MSYGSPASFGALVGSFGAGAFAGSLLFGSVGRTWPRRRTFLTSYVVGAGLIYGTLALSPPLAVALVAAIAAGLAFGPVNPIFATVTQETRRRICWDASSGRSPRSHRRPSLSEPWLWVSWCSERG